MKKFFMVLTIIFSFFLYMEGAEAYSVLGENKFSDYNDVKNNNFMFYNGKNNSELADGTYIFESALKRNMVLDAAGGKSNNGTNIQLYTRNNSYAQYFDVKKLSNGYYSIKSGLSKNVSLDVDNASNRNGTNVKLYQYSSNNKAQEWLIKASFDGSYSIVSRVSNGKDMVLDVKDARTSNGTNIQLYTYDGNPAQRFKAIPVHLNILSDGLYTIDSKLGSNVTLDLNRELAFNNTNVQIGDADNSNLQKWQLEYLGGGYYSIKNGSNTSMSLDVLNMARYPGVNVQLYSYNGNDAQKWYLKNMGNGYYSIISKCNNMALDINNGSKSAGTNVQMYGSNGTGAQLFKFNPTTKSDENLNSLDDGIYTFSSSLNDDMVLDTAGYNKTAGSNVVLNNYTGFASQMWDVKNLGNGYYSIRPGADSAMSLDVNNASMNIGTNVKLYNYGGNSAQQWIIKKTGDYYTFVSKCNGLVLDVAGGRAYNGVNVQMYASNNTKAQRFKANKAINTPLKDGIYTIANKADNKVIGLNREGIFKNPSLQLENRNGFKDQKWDVKNLGNGYYSIRSVLDTNYVMDVVGGSRNNGAYVQVYNNNNSEAQQWFLKDYGDGSYSIFSRKSGLNLASQTNKDGSLMQTLYYNGLDKQRFIFEPTSQDEPITLIENGTYSIASALNEKKVLDIAGLSAGNNVNVHLNDYTGLKSQLWNIEGLGNGYYLIKNALDESKLLDVANASTSTGANVQLYAKNGNAAQKWIIKDVGEGYYILVSSCNGLVADVSGANTANGTNIQMYYSTGNKAQKFKLNKVDNLSEICAEGKYCDYVIKSKLGDNLVLGLNTEIVTNRSNVQLENKTDAEDQKWRVKNLGGSIYSIKPIINSSMSLDVAGGGTKPGTNLQTYQSNNSLAQKWLLRDNGDGSYSIASQRNGLFIDVTGAKSEEGTNIQLYSNNDNLSQKFVFEETTANPSFKTITPGYYRIAIASNNNMQLDVTDASKRSGTNVQLYQANYAANRYVNAQIWYFNYSTSGGYYTISSALNNRLVLDVANASTNKGANVQLYPENGSDAQKWYVMDSGDNGSLKIVSKLSGFTLDMAGGNISNWSNVQLDEYKDKNSQKFKLIPFSGEKVYHGVDISHYNYIYDWSAVANNVDFAIIKAGEGKDPNYDDPDFINNARNCVNNNISYGIYWFAFNTSVDGARAEADRAIGRLNELRNNGIKLPNLNAQVWYDVESPKNGGGIANLDKTSVTNNIKAFCGRIKEAGYTCGVYASTGWLMDKIDSYDIEVNYKHPIWAAQYFEMQHPGFGDASWRVPQKPNNGGNYDASGYKIWQFASDGIIPGIGGNVDVNLGYNILDDKVSR